MNCLESYTFTKRWYLYQLDDTTKQIKQEVDLTNNPTYKLSELVIPANTLNYGFFQAEICNCQKMKENYITNTITSKFLQLQLQL